MNANHTCQWCRIMSHQDKLSGNIIRESKHFIVIHQQQPVTILGWLIIIPKVHSTDQSAFTTEMVHELADLQLSLTQLLKEKTKAEKIYWAMFSEVVKHVHFHLVPRSRDLPPEAKGPAIFGWKGDRPILDLEVDGFCDYLLQ